MRFSWWSQRVENSPELIEQLRVAFDELSPEEVAIYRVRRDGEDLYFAWPMYSVKAIKPRLKWQKPSFFGKTRFL